MLQGRDRGGGGAVVLHAPARTPHEGPEGVAVHPRPVARRHVHQPGFDVRLHRAQVGVDLEVPGAHQAQRPFLAGEAEGAAAQLDAVAGCDDEHGRQGGEVGWVAQGPPLAGAGVRGRVHPGRVGDQGVGPVVAGQLDGHVAPELVVDQRGGHPHLQVPARLQVRHPQVEAERSVLPADGLGPLRLRGVEAVPDLEAVGAARLDADIQDAHLGAGPGAQVERGEGVGAQVVAVEPEPLDGLAQIEGGVAVDGATVEVDRGRAGGLPRLHVEVQHGVDPFDVGGDDPPVVDYGRRGSEGPGHPVSLSDGGGPPAGPTRSRGGWRPRALGWLYWRAVV